MADKVEKPTGIAASLVAAMAEIDAVTKEGKNQAQGYSYVRAADVANEVRKVLAKHGIAFGFDVTEEERWSTDRFDRQGTIVGHMNYVRIVAECSFEDAATGQVRVRKGRGWGQDVGEKAIYKAMTGALKYALRMNFIIPDESDPENESEQPQRTTPAMVMVPPRPVQTLDPKPEPKQEGVFFENKELGLLNCVILGVTEKATKSGKPYVAVNFNGRVDQFNWASNWHQSLTPVLKGAVGKTVTIKLSRKKSEDGRSIQFLNIDDLLEVDGVEYVKPSVTEELEHA